MGNPVTTYKDPHAGFWILDEGTDSARHVEQGTERPLVDDPHSDSRTAADVGHQDNVGESNSTASGADPGEEQTAGSSTHENCNPKFHGNC